MTGVSVVVPTRDRDELLARAVTAIAAQEHDGPLEVVVVRGRHCCCPARRPPRRGPARARDPPGGPNTRSPGLPGARNSGILAAAHELVAFCDDDDEWLPGKLRAQLALLAARPDAALVATGIIVVHTGGSRSGAGTRIARPGPERDVLLADLLDDRIMALHPSGFLLRRADLLGSIGLVDEELAGGYGEDYDLLLRAAAHGPVVAVPEPLVRVHWHGGSYYFAAGRPSTTRSRRCSPSTRSPAPRAGPRGSAASRPSRWPRPAAAARPFARAGRALRLAPTEKRAYLAVAVAGGVLDVDRLQRWLHRRGRGL